MYVVLLPIITLFVCFSSDGKIIVHDRGSDYSVEYYGHNQEVNCIDCKGGVIVSGSRDKTAKVRLYTLFCFCFHLSKYGGYCMSMTRFLALVSFHSLCGFQQNLKVTYSKKKNFVKGDSLYATVESKSLNLSIWTQSNSVPLTQLFI